MTKLRKAREGGVEATSVLAMMRDRSKSPQSAAFCNNVDHQ